MNIFEKELSMIKNQEIASFTEIVLNNAPDKFYKLGASSTSKYHPESSNGKGGLVNHTKQVFYIAKTIIDTKLPQFWCIEDVVLSACLLHDIAKYDELNNSNYTVKNHGYKAIGWIDGLRDVKDFFSIYNEKPDWYSHILRCIHSHNGIFSQEYGGLFDTEQAIVHTADYIASRRWNIFDSGKV